MAESKDSSETIIKERKEKFLIFLKKHQNWLYYIGLIAIVIFGGIYLRTLNISHLKDVTTNSLTLAPDLDPFLFLRWAKYIAEHGSLMAVDTMRFVPLGYNTANEMALISYLIVYLYKFLSIFSPNVTVEYAAIIYPVIFFCLALIAFFLFVRKIFSNCKNANLIALISTAFISVIPGFVHRTVAGVPEKESAGIFFMFLAFYFMACSLKEEKLKKSALFGLLAGLSTGLMGLVWGGVTFMFVTIALAAFLMFFLSETNKKEIISYAAWIAGFTALLIGFPRYGLGLFTSVTSAFAYFVLGLFIFDYILFNTKLKEKLTAKIKLPEKVISLISLVAISFVLLLILEPSFISHAISDASNYIIKPFAADRLTLTVAENNRPFFNSWSSSFGLSFFWIFILGSVLLVYELFEKFEMKKRLTITFFYFLMIVGLIFSRYSSSSVMNGTNIQSLIVFLGGIALFFGALAAFYFKENRLNLDKNLLFVFAIFFFAVFSARAAIRLFYFIYPIAPIMAAFILVRIPEIAFKTKEDLGKILLFAAAVILIIAAASALYSFENSSQSEVKYASVQGHYQIQWQKAMQWTREDTPKDSVFAHWWDYGYWVQTMGERPTILDGGNSIPYWDHLMGRHVLTAADETEALEFLKTHKASYLLIDSSDIGKYPAYSSIGADENYDRYSWVSTFILDEKSSQEKRNETVYLFRGGSMLDKDLIWKGQIYPEGEAGIGAILLPVETRKDENESVNAVKQPSIVLVYQGKQEQIPIKCLYIDNKKMTFDEGIEGCFYTIPIVSQNKISNFGAGFWLSEKLVNSLMVKLYLLNETENFEIAHSENDPIINELNANYKTNLPELIYYENAGLLGPIKIWKINYPDNIQEKPEYLETEYPKKELWIPKQ